MLVHAPDKHLSGRVHFLRGTDESPQKNDGRNGDWAVICPGCNAEFGLRRERRRGLLEELLLPLFGYYPWECALCRQRFHLRQRKEPQNPKAPGHLKVPKE